MDKKNDLCGELNTFFEDDMKYVKSNVFLILARICGENVPISCFDDYDTANKFLKEYELNRKVFSEINNFDFKISFEIIEVNYIKDVVE